MRAVSLVRLRQQDWAASCMATTVWVRVTEQDSTERTLNSQHNIYTLWLTLNHPKLSPPAWIAVRGTCETISQENFLTSELYQLASDLSPGMMSQQKNLEGFQQLAGSASHSWRTSERILPLFCNQFKNYRWFKIFTGLHFYNGRTSLTGC